MALHDGLNSAFIELSETLVDEVFVKGNNVKIGIVVLQLVNRLTALLESEVPVYAELKEGLLKKSAAMMTTVIGDPNANEFVHHAVMLSGFFANYVLSELVHRVGQARLQVSEDDMKDLRHNKIEAARELNTSPYSIFVPGFLKNLREVNDLEVKAPVPMLRQVKSEGSTRPVSALPDVSRNRPADQVVSGDCIYTLRDLNTVLKEVDRLPLKATFTGLTDSRSMSAFRNETDRLAKLRHWSPAHTFHYLSRAISPEVWQMVGPEIENELSGICYSNAISQLWSNLAQLCGGVVEDEKMLDQLLGLVQDKKESVLTFLSRVSTYRDQCRHSHMPYDDSFFIMISRRGLRSAALASQTAAVVANTWNDWVRTVAMLERRSKQCQGDEEKSRQTSAVIDLTVEDKSGSGTVTTATSRSANSRVRRCYNCGKTGHLARECTADKGPRKCWKCGQIGHLASGCPNREEVSSRGSEQVANKPETMTTKAAGVNDDYRVEMADRSGMVETVIIPSRTVTFQNSKEEEEEDVGGAVLTAWWEGVPLRGLVDTGAADALLSYGRYCALQSSSASVIPLEKVDSSIQLADGSMRTVEGIVTLALKFSNGVSLVHPFYVVQGYCPSVIWGIKLLAKLGTSITICECEQGVRISTGFINEGRRSTLLCEQDSEVTAMDKSVVPDILAVRSCGDSYAISSDIEELDDDVISEVDLYTPNYEGGDLKCESYVFGWQRIPAAPKYFYRVREVHADDVIDCPGQRYVCEVRFPDLCVAEESKQVVDYSLALLAKLSMEQRRLYFDEIDSYIANSWWREESTRNDVKKGDYYNDDDPIIIFGLPQSSLKSTVMRPVADCRRLNSRMEKASYVGENVGIILSEIALAVNAVSEMNNDADYDGSVSMACLDISRAFYRIRICNSSGCPTRLWLGTCYKWYSSSRLIFGLSCGPGALEVFVQRILALAKQAGVLDGVFAWAYLDDLTLIGPSSRVKRAVLVIRELAALHGLPIPDSKAVILCSNGSSSSRTRHLGVFWDVVDHQLTVSCATFEKPVIEGKFSKRQLFSLVGKWYDGLRRHPEWSFVADTCRMIVGRWDSAWDKPHSLSIEEKKVLMSVFAMVGNGTVCHSHTLPVKCGTTIVAQCDASTIGYGWLWFLEGADQQPLCMRARWWKGGRRFWHINRKELFCIVELLLSLSDLALNKYGIKDVKVETDSRVACCWLQGASFKSITRSQERVAIGRLLMLATEAQAKLEGVTFSVRHIGKEENVRADKLSRLGTDMSSPLEEILSSTKRVQKTRMVRTDFQKVIGVGDLAELFDRQQKDPLLIGLVKRCQQAPRNEIVDNGSVFRLQERDGVRVLVRVVRIAGVPFDNFRTVLVHPVEETELKSLVEMYHDRIGHLNDRATRWHISRDWWWPGMRSMIKKICRGCKRCGDVILQRPFSVCPDNVLDYADCCKAPWQMVSGDLCGPLPMSKGYTYCLVLCDHYSRYTVVKGMKSSTAKDLVSVLMDVCSIFGFMKELRSDRAGCFSSKYTRECLGRHNVRVHLINPRSPFSNGLVERRMREVKQVFKLYGVRRSGRWFDQVPSVLRRLNNVVLPEPLHTTPFELMFGRSFVAQPGQPDQVESPNPTVEECQQRDDNLMISREWVAKMRDLREREPSRLRQASVTAGMKVLVRMATGWVGPFVVKTVLPDRASIIIADKFLVEKSEHRANLRPYYGADDVVAFL